MLRPTHRPKVLLVEDSEDDAFFFLRTMERTAVDCDVTHLSDGRAAVSYLRDALAPSASTESLLVFLDLKLPFLSGFEVLEWLARHGDATGVKVVMLSGSDDHRDVERAISLGAAGYCVKPISVARLQDYLRSDPVTGNAPGAKAPDAPSTGADA